MGDGIYQSKPPRPKVAISQFAVGCLMALLSGVVATAVVFSQPSEVEKKERDSTQASPNPMISGLPGNYGDAFKTYTPPLPQQDVSEDDDFLKALLAKEAERAKRALTARLAAVTFQGFSNPNYSRAQLASIVSPGGAAPDSERNPRDEINRQDDKLAFLSGMRDESTALSSRLQQPSSPYQLLAGSVVPGLLLTGINSDLPGELLGQVSQNVYDTVSGAYLLIPQGTRVLGTYDSRIVYGQERVLVVWTRLIFPNGSSISLEGMPGVDLSGYAGLSDQVDNHYMKLLSGVVFSSLLGAAAQMAEGPTYDTRDPSYGQLAVQGVARNSNQVGQEITRRNLNIQPTLVVRPGFRFNLYVHKDITLVPYST